MAIIASDWQSIIFMQLLHIALSFFQASLLLILLYLIPKFFSSFAARTTTNEYL